jgi:hypothetical protein
MVPPPLSNRKARHLDWAWGEGTHGYGITVLCTRLPPKKADTPALQAELRFFHAITQGPDERFEQLGEVFVLVDKQAVDGRHEMVELLLGDILPRLPAEGISEVIDKLAGQSQVVVGHDPFSVTQAPSVIMIAAAPRHGLRAQAIPEHL